MYDPQVCANFATQGRAAGVLRSPPFTFIELNRLWHSSPKIYEQHAARSGNHRCITLHAMSNLLSTFHVLRAQHLKVEGGNKI